jgi:hypothetical protein
VALPGACGPVRRVSLSKPVVLDGVRAGGDNVKLRSRFARVRVRTAPSRGKAFAEETLLISRRA